TIKIWNLETGEVESTLTGHSRWVNAIAVTPDGKTVISGSSDNTIKTWDLGTGEKKLTFKGQGYSFHVTFLHLFPDPRF
ncbi:MAG: WD40 repeat domain-containing protein, partial [Dolichospermum sp.]